MRKKLLRKLSAASFGMVEARLFLDTHPDDMEAVELYNKYCERYKALVKEYEKEYGALTLNCNNSDEWLENPWPWDNAFNAD